MGTVDWTKPIEAVRKSDGHVVPMDLSTHQPQPDSDGDYQTTTEPAGDANNWWYGNGESRCGGGWSIRNVEPTLRTSDEALRRMEALVDRLASFDAMGRNGAADMRDEARAIQALRTPPIDPRIALVVTALVQNGIGKPVAPLFARDVLKALDAESGK